MNHDALFPTERTIGLLFDPLDVLFFRDGRPFEAATRGYGGLPLPQTLMGMILTHVRNVTGLHGHEVHGLRERRGDPRRWASCVAVRGPWFVEPSPAGDGVEDIFLPPPAHLGNGGLLAPLRDVSLLPGWNPPNRDGDDLRPLLPTGRARTNSDESTKKAPPMWLNKAGLSSLLSGALPGCSGRVKQECVFTYEDRTGVGIDADSGTAQDGLIYSARFLRLEKRRMLYAEVGIEEAPGLDVAEATDQLHKVLSEGPLTLNFGGEGKRVHVQVLANPFEWPIPPTPPAADEGGYFTMLVSPAVFSVRDESKSLPWMPPCLGKLVGAAVPKPLAVSGWMRSHEAEEPDHGSPRPTRQAVPAGAVYFWQNGRGNEGRELPTMYALANDPRSRAAGWGTALRGVWKWHE